MDTAQKLEALLFFKGEPVKIKVLAKLLERQEEQVMTDLEVLSENLSQRGIRLIVKDDAALLVTAPEVSELIESAQKEELSRDIGKAGVETLSIVLYKGPVARSEIDYIRGVNSTFILRNLLIRGLIERVPNPNDSRSFLYRPTFELLSFLGISSVHELPNFDKVIDDLATFIKAAEEKENGGKSNDN